VTLPLAGSTVTAEMPGIRAIASVTARGQWPRVMPTIWNVVIPMKVRGVLASTVVSSELGVCGQW
jgi:ABC-type molybdate transport system permease subunit